MESFEAIVVRVSRPFAYNKDGVVNSCIKMLVDVKNVGKKVLTFVQEEEYFDYSLTPYSPADNLKTLPPFVFASLCEKDDKLRVRLKANAEGNWRSYYIDEMENLTNGLTCR